MGSEKGFVILEVCIKRMEGKNQVPPGEEKFGSPAREAYSGALFFAPGIMGGDGGIAAGRGEGVIR